jgi:hypothetical protein
MSSRQTCATVQLERSACGVFRDQGSVRRQWSEWMRGWRGFRFGRIVAGIAFLAALLIAALPVSATASARPMAVAHAMHHQHNHSQHAAAPAPMSSSRGLPCDHNDRADCRDSVCCSMGCVGSLTALPAGCAIGAIHAQVKVFYHADARAGLLGLPPDPAFRPPASFG